MPFRRWEEMTGEAIGALDPRTAIAVLALAATEQHGPHLPAGTDSIIAEGILAEAARLAPRELEAVLLPLVAVGASLEHARFPGTLSVPAAQLIETVASVGAGVAAAGLEKLVLVSAHGGNVAAMNAAALECRARHNLLTVTTTFARLGLPDGLVDERERELGVHAGAIETSLMLHFRPDLVAMDRAADFPSLQARLADEYGLLRAYGPVGFAWLAGDLNPAGAVGNAAAASAAIGAAIAAHQAAAFVALLTEVAAADARALLGG
jgi:creatinine amidohydrolase